MVTLSLKIAIEVAGSFMESQKKVLAAQILLAFINAGPGDSGPFTCPSSLEELMDNLRESRVEMFQAMQLNASRTLLEASAAGATSVSAETPPSNTVLTGSGSYPEGTGSTSRNKRRRGDRVTYTSLNEQNCSSIFNNMSGRIDIEREGGHLFSTLKAQPTITLRDNDGTRRNFTCTHAFTSERDYLQFSSGTAGPTRHPNLLSLPRDSIASIK